MENKILTRILNLLERTEKNGATKYEAEVALKKANELMTEYNITEFDLKKVDRSSFVDKPFQMIRLDIASLFQVLAETFDCESYYYRLKKEFHFFGFELDVKMCIHFAKMLTDVLTLEIQNYKKSEQYKELTEVYQNQMVMRNFVKGFSEGLIDKLEQMQEKKEQVILSNGTSLMVIKMQQVQDEFNRLHGDIKISKSNFHLIKSAYLYGATKSEGVCFNKPIEEKGNFLQLKGI